MSHSIFRDPRFSLEDVFRIIERASPSKCVAFCLDAEGIVLDVSGDVRDWLGMDPKEIRGHSYREFEKTYPVCFGMSRKALLRGESSENAVWYFGRFLNLRVFPVSEGGSVSVVLGFVVDGTEKAPLRINVATEREMEKHGPLLDNIFESVQDGMMILTRDFTIDRFNPAMLSFFRPGTSHCTHCYEKLHKRESPCEECVVGKTFQDGKKHTRLVWFEENDTWIEMASHPLFDPLTGHVVQVIEMVRNETQRVRFQESLRTAQFVIDHFSEPVLWISLDGEILYLNQAAAETFGHETTSTLPGEKIWQHDAGLSPETWKEFVHEALEKKTLKLETTVSRKDRTPVPVQILIDVLQQNGRTFLTACFHDLSEQMLRVAAEHASIAKSKYLAHMSHEIRTPLNGIIGLTDLMLRTELNHKQREYAELAKASGRYLLSLINDILDFAKIESGKLQIESVEFDLPELVETILGIFAGRVLHSHLELCCVFLTEIPRKVVGDPGRLRQILVNLIGNAVKFTSCGGIKWVVAVREWCEISDPPVAMIHFEVSDTGIGIPTDRLDELFDSFMQVENSFTDQNTGTGLGLAISKELVQLMGGTLEVESRENLGTTFRFTLPMPYREPNVSGAFQHGNLTLSEQCVLVVEDNDILRDVLVSQLQAWGMEVQFCRRKSTAMEILQAAALQEKPFRIAVIDSTLEDASGMDLLGEMKRNTLTAKTSVIMLTSLAENFRRSGEIAEYVDYFVSKPVFGSSLFNAVLGIMTGTDEDSFGDEDEFPGQFEGSTEKESRGITGILCENEDPESPLILIVEDNRVNQIVISEILLYAGYRFELVENGIAACEAVAEKPFSLILMDCQMPAMNGFEATRRIREMESGGGLKKAIHEGRIPIIALTANATRADENRCFEAGMDAFCSKPIDTQKLIETVRRWIPSD